MNKRPTTAAAVILGLICAIPAGAQNAGTAATGESANSTQKTFANSGASQVKHDNTAYDRSQQLGSGSGVGKDTQSTSTRNYLGNSGGLQETTTALIAPDSVSPKPIGNEAQSLGFKEGPNGEYLGPYFTRSGPSGGTLPATSTAAVDIDIINGGSAETGAIAPQAWKANKMQWGQFPTDDATPHYGAEDPEGFFGD